MFQNIFKSFQKEEQRPSSNTNCDQEDEGFLVVGQTNSDKTTVITSEFDSNIQRPPSYMEVSDQDDKTLPTYGDMQQTHPAESPSSLESHHASYPLHDVPFTVNPQLKMMWGIGQNSMPFQRRYDPSSYDYDFSLEYSIVQSNMLS